jgi:hypothetical protein
MKTTIHSYFFDIRKPEEAAQYAALQERMTARGTPCFETWSGESHYDARFAGGLEVEIDTTHVFRNQWNTAPIPGVSDKGLRVFDWAQDYPINFSKSIKKGHYLDITEDMGEIRRNTATCGYCGKQEPMQKGYVFCPHCLGSEYLKASELHLIRMKSAADNEERAELTDAERDYLLPMYKEAQLHGNTERDKDPIKKARANILSKAEKTIRQAEIERDGFLWLMDKGMPTNNCIYYTHTGKFSFGWRNPVSAEILDELLSAVSEFPYPYEVECADGRTLAG